MTPPRRPTLSTKIFLSVGNVGATALLAAVSLHLMFFYTEVAKIGAGVAGLAVLASKVWDLVNDPLVGTWSDRTRSRWGRRRIYLVGSAVPLAVATALLWRAPAGGDGGFWWALILYMVFDTFLTLTWVPLSSLAADVTSTYDDRATLAAWTGIGAAVGYAFGAAAVPGIARHAATLAEGYENAGVVLGLLAGVSFLLAGFFVKEPPVVENRRPEEFWRDLKSTWDNRPFWILTAAAGLVRMGFTLITASFPYLVTYWLQRPSKLSPALGFTIGLVAFLVPVWRWAAGRWEKAPAYSAGLIITALGILAVFLLPRGEFGAGAWAVMALTSVGLGAHWAIPFGMIPDAIDLDRWKTGERREGRFYGAFGFVDKVARALALAALGWGLQFFGHGGDEPSARALFGIRFLFGPASAICLLAGVVVLRYYPLTRQLHEKLRRENEANL